jgi:putative ABC transport system ATP-binding protein
VTKIFGEGGMRVVALDDISVQLQSGKFTAVMGPSGSGKSTLMHCLAGLDSVNAGRVFIGDTDLTALDDKALTNVRRDRVGFVFQAYNLIPTLTALENIRLPLDLAGREPDQPWFDTVIDTIGLRDRLEHRPSELSGGQQQRVACARAMVSRPDVIFADEPTGNLDSHTADEVFDAMIRLSATHGTAFVIVTHDSGIAARAERVFELKDGKLSLK